MTKKRILPDDRIAECHAAHELFLAKKNELKLSQKKIADEANMTPAAVNLYFKGINPLNAQFAAVLSRVLQVPVESFSPRLAREIEGLSKVRAIGGEKLSAAAQVQKMLEKHGKGLTSEARQKIAMAVEESLAEQAMAPAEVSNVIVADFSRRPTVGDEIRIAHYDVAGIMGNDGKLVHDYPEMFADVTVSQKHLRELGVKYQDPSHLKLITGDGQSMAPTINDKDPVIVDVTVNEFTGDGVYGIIWQGLFYIKRLQVLDAEHFEMISDNPNHKDRVIRMDDTYIKCKVLLVWNAKRV